MGEKFVLIGMYVMMLITTAISYIAKDTSPEVVRSKYFWATTLWIITYVLLAWK